MWSETCRPHAALARTEQSRGLLSEAGLSREVPAGVRWCAALQRGVAKGEGRHRRATACHSGSHGEPLERPAARIALLARASARPVTS